VPEKRKVVRTGTPGVMGAIKDAVEAVGRATAPRSVTQIKHRNQRSEEQATDSTNDNIKGPKKKSRYGS
jgi:uncharacterized protein YqgV (UPF0045/DUF77 family)